MNSYRREHLSHRQITVFVLTHSGAHSFLKVLRHQLGHSGQDICDAV